MLLFSAKHGLFTQDDSNNITTSVSAGGRGNFTAIIIIYMTFLWWICFCYEELLFKDGRPRNTTMERELSIQISI